MRTIRRVFWISFLLCLGGYGAAWGFSGTGKANIFDPGQLKPVDSTLKVKIGEPAPDFTLPSVSGEKITLSRYRGKKQLYHLNLIKMPENHLF